MFCKIPDVLFDNRYYYGRDLIETDSNVSYEAIHFNENHNHMKFINKKIYLISDCLRDLYTKYLNDNVPEEEMCTEKLSKIQKTFFEKILIQRRKTDHVYVLNDSGIFYDTDNGLFNESIKIKHSKFHVIENISQFEQMYAEFDDDL